MPVPEYKAETLYYGTKVGLGPCLQTLFGTSRAVQCFVLVAKSQVSKWRPTGRNGVFMYTAAYRVLKV